MVLLLNAMLFVFLGASIFYDLLSWAYERAFVCAGHTFRPFGPQLDGKIRPEDSSMDSVTDFSNNFSN